MEVDSVPKRMTENTSTESAPLSVSVFLKPGKVDDCSNNQAVALISKHASHPAPLSPVTSTKSRNITATLENESVWSRFHSLGTEMVLTKQGRRMFPCCRFKLSGLDPERKYNLVMDIMPLDDFTHKWNGKMWEPTEKGEPHVFGQVCVHPDSPALGQLWMESPVSFYKVKLTNNSTDQEGSVFLHQMHRYQPRLHVVPEDPHSKEVVALDSPNVQVFTFTKTAFYAVTSYQNPQITQLKIDCNPFAMAFRKDSQSIRLLQDRLGLCCPSGQQTQLPAVDLARYSNEQNRERSALKHGDLPCIEDHRRRWEEGDGILTKMKNAASSYLNGVSLCKEDMNSSENDNGQEVVVKQPLAPPALCEHIAPLDTEPHVTASIQVPPQTINGLVSSVSSAESLKFISEDVVNSQISYAHEKSPVESAIPAQVSHSRGRRKLKVPAVLLPKQSLLYTNEVNRRNATAPFRRKPFRRAKKPKSKWWSNAKYSKRHSVITPLDVSLRPDLEDVDGMLFVSFTEKEALDIHVQNMKHVEASVSPVPETQSQPDTQEVEDVSLSVHERIFKLESILLLHLKRQKHRQVIHPLLQEVGIKLCFLDPAVSIDLQYLGVSLPFPPPIHSSLDQMSLSSHDSAGSFVSRTGKTNDPTKIKGWRDKLNPTTAQNTPEGPRNISAFCSDLLDEYLENEAQQISDRAAVFSKSFSTPVSYQLPSKSSSYVVTLGSLLKNRCTPLNKVCSNPANNIQTRPPLKSPKESVPLSSEGPHYTTFESKENDSNLASSFQGDQAISSASHGTKNRQCRPQLRWSCAVTPAKMQVQSMLQDMEKDALFHGKVHTHITSERANFALSSLLTSKKSVKRTKLSLLHLKELACSEEFCRLGCICDSLQRKIRGPVHCRRVQCMFDCDCFRHKVLLIHPPKVTENQETSRRALMAFHTEKDDRPPPASSITTLWKCRTEDDNAEPLFVPEPAPSLKLLRKRNSVPCPAPQIQEEEEKDPVYLYFESMMTCARVREYNSNPPPQLHMLPNKKLRQGAEKFDLCTEAGVPPTSQKKAEKNTTNVPKCAPSVVEPEEPGPTKMLEILSECNWEPHRNLVLNALFWRISNNLLSEPFCLGVYKVQLLSTSLKKGETCSTVTYKVCVSRAEEQKATSDQLVKKPVKTGETQTKKGNGTVSKPMAPRKKDSPLIGKPLEKSSCKNTSRISPLHSRAGYLKADKKNSGGPALGLVKVNGKTYNEAKLLLGQMGALHPANRFAAFVTGRLKPRPQHQPKVLADVPKHCLAQASVEPSAVPNESNTPKPTRSVSPRPHPARVPEPNTVSERTKKSKLTSFCALSTHSDESTPLKEDISVNSPIIPPVTTPTVSAGSKLPLPVPPLNLTVTPSTGTVTIPSGQKMVLQYLPGVSGSNMCCLYNGQIIRIVPVAPGPIGQPQPCLNSEGSTSQVAQTAANTYLPKDNKSVQKPLSTPTETLLRTFPVTAPKILSLSGSSGMSIASGTPAFNLQSSFPGKTGTFSFRICPPSAEGKATGSKPGAKPPDPRVATPSTLLLPGGFTLIKLPLGSDSGLPASPADTTTASHPVEVPPKVEPVENEISQSCSHYTEQRCQTSEDNTSAHILETSKNSSTDAAGSSDGRSAVNSEGFGKGELKEETLDSVNANSKTGKYDWVSKGAEMVLKSDDNCKSEEDDLDDWPPKGAEQVLWTDEDSVDDEENEDFIEHNSNADASVSNPAGMTASNSKNTARTDISPSAFDECHFEETDISECPQTHRKSLPPETNEHSKKSQASAEPKQHMKASLPAEDKENIHDDSFANASTCTLKNSEQEPHQNDSSIEVKEEPSNKPEETFSSSPYDIQKNVLLQEDCSPTPTYTEPYNNLTQKHMVDSQSSIRELTPKTSSPVITETEATDNVTLDCKLSNHFGSTEQCLGSGDIFRDLIQIEPNSDPPQPDTCFDPLAKEQSSVPENILPVSHRQAASKNHTVVSNHLDDNNKQNSESNTSQMSPGEADLLFSTSSKSSSFLQQDEDENDDIDIVGDVSCPLLEGQTLPISVVPVQHLPSLVSKKTDPKSSSLSLKHKSVSGNNKLQCKFGKHYSQTFKKAEPVSRKDDVPEEPKLEKRNRFQFQKSHHELHIDEENDVSHMNLYDEDEDPGNVSDSDRSEVSRDKNERNSSSDEEDSSNDLESSINSETPNESANTSSEEDETVDIESFDENQEKLIVTKMKGKITKYREARQMKATKKEFRKKVNQSVDTFDRNSLSANKPAGRLTHTEKERVRRGEMRQSFASLKTALNIEEQIKICKDDILIQARLMIRALEDRNRTLEERKKALLQRQSAYVSTIAELAGKTEDMVKTNFKEHCDQEKCLDLQNLVPAPMTSLKVNPQQLDREDNQVSPRLGLWKSKINHTRRRSEKTSGQSSTAPTGKRKKMVKQSSCEEDTQLDDQNLTPVPSPPKKPRRLDSEGNHLPPRLGLWKSINYIRKRSKRSSTKPSVTPTAFTAAVDESSDTCTSSPVSLGNQVTEPLPSFRPEDVILKLVAQTSSGLPPIPKLKHLTADPGPSGSNTVPELDQGALRLPSVPNSKTALSQKAVGPFTLPKIVLQSFGKTDTSEKLTCLEKSPPLSSPHTPKSAEISLDVTWELQNEETGTERVNSTNICKEAGKSSGSEESNQENPSLSPPLSESSLQSHNVPDIEKDRETTTGILKVRKRRAKSEVVKDASCDFDTLGARMLRNKSPASNRMSTRSTPREKRMRLFE